MRYACCSLDGRGGHEAGWALPRQLYLEETGQPLPPVRLTKRGKPYFPDSPYHFSTPAAMPPAFWESTLWAWTWRS